MRERGNYGLLTKAAVRGFQTGAKLPVTGALEPRTWQLVRAAEAARKDYLASTGIPASISKVRSVTYQASEIINRIYLEDWVANINEARREYFKSGGHTAKPLAPREVEKILSEAGKLKIVENEAEWKRVMKGDMTSLGGVVVDKETRRMKEIVINPYIKNGTTWSAPLHEVEHVIKEYAGVPGQALVKGGTDFYKDTVHHRTTRDSETRTLYRMYPAPERPWYERLVRYISGRGK